jgi:hypothetical protein
MVTGVGPLIIFQILISNKLTMVLEPSRDKAMLTTHERFN